MIFQMRFRSQRSTVHFASEIYTAVLICIRLRGTNSQLSWVLGSRCKMIQLTSFSRCTRLIIKSTNGRLSRKFSTIQQSIAPKIDESHLSSANFNDANIKLCANFRACSVVQRCSSPVPTQSKFLFQETHWECAFTVLFVFMCPRISTLETNDRFFF